MGLSRFWTRRPWSLPRAPRHSCRPSVEGLEDRSLLSITLPKPGQPGPAIITGSAEPDRFQIRIRPDNASQIQFLDEKFPVFLTAALSDVTEIDVNTLGEADTLTIDNSSGLVAKIGGLPVVFDGGTGADQLVLLGDPLTAV